jgi:hypothetical protein
VSAHYGTFGHTEPSGSREAAEDLARAGNGRICNMTRKTRIQKTKPFPLAHPIGAHRGLEPTRVDTAAGGAIRCAAHVEARARRALTDVETPLSASPAHAALLLASVPLLLGFQLLIFDRWISFMDEGHILQLADIVAGGGELYRDATTYPLPGSYYLLAWVFELLGASNRAARYLVSLEFAVLGVCVVLILRRFVSPALAAIGLVLVIVYRVWSFPHWHIYTYSATALCLLAVALVLMLRFLESGDRRVLAASGLVAGLGVLCKQDYGAAGLLALNLALLLWFVERRARESEPLVPLLLWMNVPALAVGALTIGYFASQGLLVELLRQTVWNHIAGIAAFEYSSLPPVLPLFEQDPGLRDPYGVSVYAPAIVFTADWSGFAKSAFYNDTSLYEIGLKTFFYAPYGLVAIGGCWSSIRAPWCAPAGAGYLCWRPSRWFPRAPRSATPPAWPGSCAASTRSSCATRAAAST